MRWDKGEQDALRERDGERSERWSIFGGDKSRGAWGRGRFHWYNLWEKNSQSTFQHYDYGIFGFVHEGHVPPKIKVLLNCPYQCFYQSQIIFPHLHIMLTVRYLQSCHVCVFSVKTRVKERDTVDTLYFKLYNTSSWSPAAVVESVMNSGESERLVFIVHYWKRVHCTKLTSVDIKFDFWCVS